MHPDVMIHHLALCHENKIASLIMIMNSQSAQGSSSQDPLSQVPSHPQLYLTCLARGKRESMVIRWIEQVALWYLGLETKTPETKWVATT